ncbi:MAG: hypothetical protein LBT46_00030 [Planctomycetaceae bacterium]|jgi:hypothetical protein|nr:hypothetical protein [Planctomycetaceae bacterium]
MQERLSTGSSISKNLMLTFTAYKILTSQTAKYSYFALLVLITFYWACNGWSWCRFQSKNDAEKTVTELTEKLRQNDPKAAAELAQLQENYNVNALAATLKERQKMDGIDGLVRLAQARDAYDLHLAGIAVNPHFIVPKERENFLTLHVNHLQSLQYIRNQTDDINLQTQLDNKTAEYLLCLDTAKQDPDTWRKVRDNPMYIRLAMLGIDQSLLDFYDAEKDWLDDILFALTTLVDSAENDTVSDVRIILETAKKYHPLFRDAVRDYTGDAGSDALMDCVWIYTLFENNGDAIRFCKEKGNFELGNLLSVMLANPGFCGKYADRPEEFAARLITIKQEMPDVWRQAGEMFVLHLADDVPQLANKLLRKYGQYGIAAFLYANYPDAVPQAAAALEKFGDLAVFILNRYASSEIFHKALQDNQLAVRIIPYTARFEDKGLERLDENKAWLDKYFDEQGTAKKNEWWTMVPGGSLVKVAKNWTEGLPSEWGEIGWAAVDTADIALLALTLGQSAWTKALSPAPVPYWQFWAAPAQQTAWQSGTLKSLKFLTETVRPEVSAALKTGGRKTTQELMELPAVKQLMKEGFSFDNVHSWVITLQKEAAKTGGKRAGNIALHQALTLPKNSMQIVRRNGKLAAAFSVTKNAAVPVRILTNKIFETAKSLSATWKANPALRQLTYRTLLATGLAITLYCRTIPGLREALPQIGENVGRFIAQSVETGAETAASVLNGFISELSGIKGSSKVLPFITYLAVLAVFAALTCWCGRRLLFKPAVNP